MSDTIFPEYLRKLDEGIQRGDVDVHQVTEDLIRKLRTMKNSIPGFTPYVPLDEHNAHATLPGKIFQRVNEFTRILEQYTRENNDKVSKSISS